MAAAWQKLLCAAWLGKIGLISLHSQGAKGYRRRPCRQKAPEPYGQMATAWQKLHYAARLGKIGLNYLHLFWWLVSRACLTHRRVPIAYCSEKDS